MIWSSWQEQAEGMLGEEMRWRGWTEPELQRRGKGDRDKLAMAHRLQRETRMSLKWIAVRLALGNWTTVSYVVSARRRLRQ